MSKQKTAVIGAVGLLGLAMFYLGRFMARHSHDLGPCGD